MLLTVLLLVLGGLLDGLYGGFTGALRAQPGELVAYAADARLSMLRSRIDTATTAEVARTPGVRQVGGLGVALLGATGSDTTDTSVALFGYQRAPRGVPAPPPPTGEVCADTSVRACGPSAGRVLRLGRQR